MSERLVQRQHGRVKSSRLRFSFDSLSERRVALLFILPCLLVLAVVFAWPMLFSMFLSFHKVDVFAGEFTYEFIGLRNYFRMFEDPRFLRTLWQTAIYSFARVSGILVIAFALALLLNQAVFGVRLFKPLFLLPWALAFVVNGLMWGWIFNGSYGLFNAILVKFGFLQEYHVWLADPMTALAVITFAEVWKGVPFATLMIVASLKTVPAEIMDAAKVDGASAVGRFVHVTLPWLRPVVAVLLTIQTMWSLKTFDIIWVLTKGGPSDSTMVLNVLVYQESFMFFKFGYGSAIAYVSTFFIVILTLTYFKVLGFED